MLRKTAPDPYDGDWKSSVAVGSESGTGNRQFMRLSGTQTPLKLRLCWILLFIYLFDDARPGVMARTGM